MRRRDANRLVVLGTTVGFVASMLGCTFLIGFDDLPPESEDAATVTRERDSAVPSAADAPADVTALTTGCDPDFPKAEIVGCDAIVDNGQVCARSTLFRAYPTTENRETDLVTCAKNAPLCVQHCSGVGGCASLPNGYPDQCDACQGRADGTYCGSDFAWPAKHFVLLIRCAANRIATKATACAAGCDPKTPGTAACR